MPAVEALLTHGGADLFAPAPVSELLPIHLACDRRAPVYTLPSRARAFVNWMLEKMVSARKERASGGGGGEGAPGVEGAGAMEAWPEDVVTKLRAEVPKAFWSRGCDPAMLGIDEALRQEVAPAGETRQRMTYGDLDDL